MSKETTKPENAVENKKKKKEKKERNRKKFSFNKKKFRYGGVATIITVVFIAFVVFINLIAGVLTDRKNLKLDLTAEKYYEVSEQTTDYLKKIDQDVEIAVMGDEDDYETGSTYTKMIIEILDRYKQGSDHVSVEFYDVASNPDVISKFSENYNGEISDGNIVVSCGDRVKVMTVSDLFTIETSSYTGSSSITGFNGEQVLTSAIMSVTDANPKKVAFIAQYNGSTIYSSYISYSVSSFYSLLDSNGYEITTVDIFSDELSPDDYDMVILPAPMTDISEDCITKLEDFLYNGGNLDKDMIYIADVYQYKTPNIDDFLEVWGIEIGDSWVYETDDSMTQNAQIVLGQSSVMVPSAIVSIADETYSEDLSNTKLPIIAPYARSINLLFDANVDRTTSALLVSSDTACQYPIEMKDAPSSSTSLDENGEETTEEATEEETEETTEFDPDTADKSSQVVMAIATKTNTDDDSVQHVNNLMVMGGSELVDQIITSSDLYNNAEFVINAVNQMCGKENGIIISEKNITTNYIDVTAAQSRVINRIVLIVIPAAVVIIGIVVFVRRRNR